MELLKLVLVRKVSLGPYFQYLNQMNGKRGPHSRRSSLGRKRSSWWGRGMSVFAFLMFARRTE